MWLNSLPNFREAAVTEDDFKRAREAHDYDVSLFDILHLLICKRESAVLVTRDKRLIDTARQFVLAGPPEDFLIY